MKIAIAGTGYVGLSNAVLLAQHHEVVALDIVEEKVAMINNKQSPIVDADIERFLANETLNLRATTDHVRSEERRVGKECRTWCAPTLLSGKSISCNHAAMSAEGRKRRTTRKG